MPISVHGFVVVFKRVDADNYCAIIENISDELYASGEWNRLKEEAIAMTEEAVADEFGDQTLIKGGEFYFSAFFFYLS